jgi:drug/metabolite transporter (DMT)-like permease
LYLILPLIAALAFALGSIVFKRAYHEGAGVVHAVVVNNVVLGIAFLPLLAIDEKAVPWDLWYLPVLTSLTFVTGHLLNVMSLRIGDVSIATPLLGVKVTFVALLAWAVFGTRLNSTQWVAAGLTTLGVLLMGRTDFTPGRRLGLTTLLALGCALAFAFTDVMIQSWAARLGVWNFLSLVFASLAILSLAMLPVFGRESLRAPRAAWRWILAAAGLSGMQAILITGTIGIWKDAAGVNVVYATRGILSIVLVWFLGARLKNTERQAAGPAAMAWRSAGAALILAAVVLAVKGSPG